MAKDKNNSDNKIKKQLAIDATAGVLTGVICTGVLNPWDRALYLSVKYNRNFIARSNFQGLYEGVWPAILQRAFSGSIYYVMQGQMKCYLYPFMRHNFNTSETLAQLSIGLTAGSVSGLLTNGISAIKYHTWGHAHPAFLANTKEMWTTGGIKPFIKGAKATMARDIIFGCTYEVTRNFIKDHKNNSDHKIKEFLYNGSAAGLATVLSGPLNYVRNIQYATPPEKKPPSILNVLKNLWMESKMPPNSTSFKKVNFFQKKFLFGWGTGRVMTGMALGQYIFDTSREDLKNFLINNKTK